MDLVRDADTITRFQTRQGIDQLQRRQGLYVDRLSLPGLCLLFTGTVLLHLYAAALARRNSLCTKSIPAVYIPVPSPFTELEDFILESARAYDLDLFTCSLDSDAPLPVESVTPGIATPGALKSSKGYIGHTGFSGPVGKAPGGEGMRRALQIYKEKYQHIEAILIGTRKSDPHGGEFFLLPLDEWPSNIW